MNARILSLWFAMMASCPVWAGGDNINKATLYRVDVSPSGLLIGVIGQGCTKLDDFKLHAWPGKPITMVIERVRPDRCRGKRRAYSFSVPFDLLSTDIQQELQKGGRFILTNPLVPLPTVLRDSVL